MRRRRPRPRDRPRRPGPHADARGPRRRPATVFDAAQLARCRHRRSSSTLRWLSLHGVIRTASGLHALAALRSLEVLGLAGTWHRDGERWLDALAGLTQVQTLDLSSVFARAAADLAPLGQMTALRTLGLHGLTLTDASPGAVIHAGVTTVSGGLLPWVTAAFPQATSTTAPLPGLRAEGKLAMLPDLVPPSMDRPPA